MSSIGDLVVHLQADTKHFQRGLRQSQTQLQRFSSMAKGLAKAGAVAGLAAIGAAAAATAAQFQKLDKIGKTSDKLGISTEAIAGLGLAFEHTGVNADAGMIAMQRMTRRIADAANGAGPAVKALDELGLSAQGLNKLTPDKALAEVADAMKDVTSQSDKVRLAFSLFDSEGVGLVNTLAGGAAGLAEFQKEADRLNLSHTREEIARVEAANDAITRITGSLTGAFQNLAIVAAPVIEVVADGIGNLTQAMAAMADSMTRLWGDSGAGNPAVTAQQNYADTSAELQKVADAAKEAAKETERLDRVKKSNASSFADTMKEVRTQLKISLGLMTEIDAIVERQRGIGVSDGQLAELRQLLEARKQLDDAKVARSPAARLAGFAQKGSAEAFKIIAQANKPEKLEQLAAKQVSHLKELVNQGKDKPPQIVLQAVGAV